MKQLEKVKQDFVDDYLSKMFEKLSAEKIVKIIKWYEYNKDTEDNKKKARRVYSWDRGKKVDDKYVAEDGDYEESIYWIYMKG